MDRPNLSDPDVVLRELRAAYRRDENIVCVHYACENFYKVTDRPAGVSCICVTRITREDTTIFSPTNFSPKQTPEEREIALLDGFYDALRSNPDARLVHWNMNAAHYGFAAIASRYRFLTGKEPPYAPPRDRTYDLDAIITAHYGESYAKHPKLKFIAGLNDCSMRFFLSGPEEAEKLSAKDYGAIERSTSEKVRIVAQLFVLLCRGALRTINSVGAVEFASEYLDAVAIMLKLGERFRNIERSLRHRHGSRPTLEVKDEYDAQDLLRALLQLFFGDIRDEEWTPSYAGAGSRIDFLIPEYRLAVELKYARPTLKAKELGEQLIVDRDRYKEHGKVSHLVCLVFDYDGLIDNPRGLEKDLSATSSEQTMAVTVQVYDR